MIIGRCLRTALLGTALCAAGLECWTACNKKDAAAPPPAAAPADAKVRTGHGLYLANCIACHNANPALDGSLGPAIKGSTLELVQARVLRGDYPAGYAPKRATHIMVKLPLSEDNVAAIQAYLASP